MKNLVLVSLILLTACVLSSCSKESISKSNGSSKSTGANADTTNQPIVPIDRALLADTWQVINDTSTTVPWGLWEGRPTTGQNYKGKPADYYKFDAEGDAFNRVNGVIDTGNYTISRDTLHIVYTYFNGQLQTGGIYNSFWTITNLTAHTATVTAMFVSPETATTSVTYLRK